MKEIPLTQDKFALVDDEDYDWLNQWKWSLQEHKNIMYAVRGTTANGVYLSFLMHRQILGLCHGNKRQTDHKNGNGLDNRRLNLRVCNHAQNQFNRRSHVHFSSKFKGVCKIKNKWHANIQVAGNLIHLGKSNDEIEAAKIYDKAAKEYFGDFARINFN